MLDLVYGMPPLMAVIIILVLTSIACVAALLALRRFLPYTWAEPHNEVAGFFFGAVGVVYAVVLAFVLVVMWERFTDTDNTIEHEASSLGAMLHEARALPEPEATEVRRRVCAYTGLVLRDEWETMSRAAPSEKAHAEHLALWAAVRSIKPTTAAESNWHQALITRLNSVVDSRRVRLSSAAYEAPPLLWIILVVGATVTVAFSYLYGVKNIVVHSVMTSALAGLIVLTMFTIYELEYPFRGSQQADAGPFERQLAICVVDFGAEGKSPPVKRSP